MKSYEVIRQAVEEPGVKAVAQALKVSPALVYKWCEPPAEADDPDQSGAKNPLDRVREMFQLTRHRQLIQWLCGEAGGTFVENPDLQDKRPVEESIFAETRKMLREFSELLDEVDASFGNDRQIDLAEAEKIRGRWEDLKAAVERFVLSCERGQFSKKGKEERK